MSSLNPCPFCGSDTRINRFTRRIGKAAHSIFQTAQIKCKRQSCGMSGPLWKGGGCQERALAHWNRCVFINAAKNISQPDT